MIWSDLMDAKSLFLTANADTPYFFGYTDLSKGPMVFEAPPNTLGVIDDMWWRWVTDFGAPGPDRGEGGKYLLVHRSEVEKAMRNRCSVPEKVLEEYPDLKDGN